MSGAKTTGTERRLESNGRMAAEIRAETGTERGHSRVTKNAIIYLAGQLVSWLMAFVAVSIIPRRLGEQAVGEIAVAGTVVATLVTLVGLGVDSFLVKEVGRDRRQSETLLRATLGLRLASILPLTLFSLLTFSLIHTTGRIWALGLLAIGAGVLTLLADPMRSVLAGWEDAKRVSLLDLALTVAPLFAVPFLAYGPVPVNVAVLVMTGVVLLLRAGWLKRSIHLLPVVDFPLWKQLIGGGLPFIANNLIVQVYSFLGIFILRYYTDDAAVGVYAQAVKLFGTFLFIPTALGYALLPSLSRLASAGAQEFRQMQVRVLGLLIVIGLPVTTLVMMLAGPVCRLLYGAHKFAALPAALQIYALAIIPLYIVSIMYQFLVAQNRNGIWTGFLALTVGLYALVSVVLTPWTLHHYGNGVLGAVGATFVAEGCSAVFALILLRTKLFSAELGWRVVRAAGATVVMAGVIRATQGLFVVIPASLGLLVFAVLTWALRLLAPEEQEKIALLFRRFARR